MAARRPRAIVNPSRPATLVPPPLIYAAALALTWWLNRRLTLPFDAGAGGGLLAPLLVAAGIGITFWAAVEIWRHRSTVNPYRAASALVTTGPFQYSRNPIYVADWLVYAGVALWLQSWWAAILAPLAWFAIRFLVIAFEERHLEAKFGDDYRNYRSRVRRWL
jgi:protein-S-isoprenylcysteine O-methyltransferase Ste14